MQIENAVVVVTGASSGIGKATAVMAAARGARVALIARRKGHLDELTATLPGSFARVADVTDFDDFRAALEEIKAHFGRVDALVNNAGIGYEAAVEHIDPQIFADVYRLNVIAPIVGMQTVVPWMREQGEGSIVNISSGTAFMNVQGYEAYASSKRALNGLSLTARVELEPSGIKVSVIYPFITATEFGHTKLATKKEPVSVDVYAKGDPPELVAALIIQAIEEGGAEYFANDRLRAMAYPGER